MNKKDIIKKAINDLIGHAYDSGYYSGKKEDGEPHHKQSIKDRQAAKERLLKLINA